MFYRIPPIVGGTYHLQEHKDLQEYFKICVIQNNISVEKTIGHYHNLL